MNPNSLCNWWPKVQGLDVPMPRTEIVRVGRAPEDLLYSGDIGKLVAPVIDAVLSTGGCPAFIRTDLMSGKHSYEHTCLLRCVDKVEAHLVALAENQAMCLWYGSTLEAFVVREFLELDWLFYAFDGLPIASERRFFVRDGKIVCKHPYWPEDAIDGHGPTHDEWRHWLRGLNNMRADGSQLDGYATRVAAALPGAWSIDFARHRLGEWYFIDAALAEESWHPEGCLASLEVTG